MALQKDENFNGITCNYWKILNLTTDYLNETTTALLGLYKDSSTRSDDIDNVVDTIKIVASGINESRADMYPECKGAGEYLENASDV